MSLLLAIDTGSGTTGAAVVRDGEVAAENVEVSGPRHSQRLFTLIDNVIAGAKATREEIDMIAVTRGPGSFTGLRVGVATAKGLGYGLSVKVAGVSSLKALAMGAMPIPWVVASCFDARKGQVYGAAYDGLTGETLIEEGGADPLDFGRALADLGRKVLVVGSGLGKYADLFGELLGEEQFVAGPEHLWEIRPGNVALLGLEAYESGESVDAELLMPVYHRLSEAELAKKKK